MWLFALLPEFIPGIFILLATLILSLVDSSIILSGFASPTFIIVLSIIMMTVSIMQSGIMKRFILSLLRHTHTLHLASWALFGFGLIITPILPSIINRAQITGPLVKEISESLKTGKDGNELLYTSGFLGVFLLSSSFLSASLLNFIIFSLLPLQEQQQFQTQGWLQGTLVMTGFLVIAYMLIVPLFFRKKEKIEHKFNLSLEKMGKIKVKEVISLGALFIFFIGMLTTQHHHISSSWLGFSILFLLLALGYVNLNDFQRKVDWPYLFFLSSIVGISAVFKSLGLDIWLYNHLLTAFPEILKDKMFLFAFIAAVTLILRFMLPVGAVVALLAPTILAIATKVGVSGWALCMVLLLVGDIWFFPYQCTFYRIYKAGFNNSKINERKFLIINALVNVIKLIALFLSFYYWKYLSLI
ncbi:MAG: TRAP transporter large permease subunit [Alphaproteobacteria bacterium]|nr:TRAP transporter large permease subunit [Alphaproteobacteria bacterium]